MGIADVVARVNVVARDQWGLVTAAQMSGLGISRNSITALSKAGVIEPVRRGVYLHTAHDWGMLTEIRAAWLSLEPQQFSWERVSGDIDAVVSGVSACRVHDLGGMRLREYSFFTAQHRQVRGTGIRTQMRDLRTIDFQIVNGIPVTSVEQTIADLYSGNFGVDLEHLAHIFRDAEGLDVPKLRRLLAGANVDKGYDPEGLLHYLSGAELLADYAGSSSAA